MARSAAGTATFDPLVRSVLRQAGRRDAARTLAVTLCGALLEGAGLTLLVPILAVTSSGAPGGAMSRARTLIARFAIATPLGQLAVLLAGFVAVMAARAVVLMARDRRINTWVHGYVEHERIRLMTALATADWHQVSRLRHARVTNALNIEMLRVATAARLLLQIVVAAVMLAMQLVVVIVLAPALGGLAVIAMLVGALRLRRPLRRAADEGARSGLAHLALVDTSSRLLGGLKAACAENTQGAFLTLFAATSAELSAGQLAHQRRLTEVRVYTSTGVALAGAALLLVGFLIEGPTPVLLAALLVIGRTVSPALGLHQNLEQLATLLPAKLEIDRLVGELAYAPSSSAALPTVAGASALTFDRVTFRHPDGGGVEDVTLDVAAGEIVGIAGPSGSGKTTCLDLTTGLIEPSRGTVRVDGHRLTRGNAPSWRERIAYVGQEIFLANDTVRANLTWGFPQRDEAELWAALERAQLAQVIRAMPGRLDTVVDERGTRLSGGERQRLAIARALLRRPALLILDEATNAIDVATERTLLSGIARLQARPTVLVVAHRPETLALCTRRLRIEAGRLVADERG